MRNVRARPRLVLAVVALLAVLSFGAMAGGDFGDHGYGPGHGIERGQHVDPH